MEGVNFKRNYWVSLILVDRDVSSFAVTLPSCFSKTSWKNNCYGSIWSMFLSWQRILNFWKISNEKVKLETCRNVREKIHNALASKFGIASSNIYLTKPTFFSRLTNKPPLSTNDEYWHPHVDKVSSTVSQI